MKLTIDTIERLDDILINVDQEHPEYSAIQTLEELGNLGICNSCQTTAHGVEPDAEGYDCPSCDQPQVLGIELALLSMV